MESNSARLGLADLRKPWFLTLLKHESDVYVMTYCMYNNKIWSDYETCGIFD